MTQDFREIESKAAELLNRKFTPLDESDLIRFVSSFIGRRKEFATAAEEHGSPLYLVDTDALRCRARTLRQTFTNVLPAVRIYYAIKSNHHSLILTTLLEEGFGLDVSSGTELRLALAHGAKEIIFSGPGKQSTELRLAVENADRVTVLIDSFGELKRLNDVAAQAERVIRCGVRLTTEETGLWKKFGIPLHRLAEFITETSTCRWLDFRGLQFHISWNLNPEAQAAFIARLGAQLSKLAPEQRVKLEFVDSGGGFWPEDGEWIQSAATPCGMVRTALEDNPVHGLGRYKQPACAISEFAEGISAALHDNLPSDMKPAICLEPGRWLCHHAMHILLTVADVKARDIVITDGGTNAVGWERFETDYFPVINLSRPSLEEHECLVAGSLCTPHDLWGYSYFGKEIHEGDLLLVPNQGAYTYSLRQEFIKPLPRCVQLGSTARTNATVVS